MCGKQKTATCQRGNSRSLHCPYLTVRSSHDGMCGKQKTATCQRINSSSLHCPYLTMGCVASRRRLPVNAATAAASTAHTLQCNVWQAEDGYLTACQQHHHQHFRLPNMSMANMSTALPHVYSQLGWHLVLVCGKCTCCPQQWTPELYRVHPQQHASSTSMQQLPCSCTTNTSTSI
jgi:hypothetical protein